MVFFVDASQVMDGKLKIRNGKIIENNLFIILFQSSVLG